MCSNGPKYHNAFVENKKLEGAAGSINRDCSLKIMLIEHLISILERIKTSRKKVDNVKKADFNYNTI